jgi:hypothetical protein
MTMTEGTVPVPPSAFPNDGDPLHSSYGFQCDMWLDYPTTNRPFWFSSEERSRREANAYAYRQTGTKENWFRYLSLGYFVFEDMGTHLRCNKNNEKIYSIKPHLFHVKSI